MPEPLSPEPQDAARDLSWSRSVPAKRHTALFFDDGTLIPVLAAHIVDDLVAQRVVCLVLSPGRLSQLRSTLPLSLLEHADDQHRLVTIDAHSVMSQLLSSDGWLDAGQFGQAVGETIAVLTRRGMGVDVYSELGSLLRVHAGADASDVFERLWDDLCRRAEVTSVCVFPVPRVAADSADSAQELARISLSHSALATGRDLLAPPIQLAPPARVVLEAVRRLLRTESPEEAVGILMEAVRDLGGTTAPAHSAPADALHIDVSLGEADPLLPIAPPGSLARRALERELPGLVEDARACADRARRLARLSTHADTDPLTGLGNRRGLRRLRDLKDLLTVALIDLDHFKRVNDTQGHDAGDRVLVGFSRMLRRHLRDVDMAFRLGGEEFLVIMPATPPGGALVALENLRHRWAEERPLPVTFSAGVCSVEDGLLQPAIDAADRALYVAKRGGRDRFVVAPGPEDGSDVAGASGAAS